jgi:hypothetical protein
VDFHLTLRGTEQEVRLALFDRGIVLARVERGNPRSAPLITEHTPGHTTCVVRGTHELMVGLRVWMGEQPRPDRAQLTYWSRQL